MKFCQLHWGRLREAIDGPADAALEFCRANGIDVPSPSDDVGPTPQETKP